MLKPKNGSRKDYIDWMYYKSSSFRKLDKFDIDALKAFVCNSEGKTIKEIAEFLGISNDKARAAAFDLCVAEVFDFATTKINHEVFRSVKSNKKGCSAGWVFFENKTKKQIRLIPKSSYDIAPAVVPVNETTSSPANWNHNDDIKSYSFNTPNERLWSEFTKYMMNNDGRAFMQNGELQISFKGPKGDMLRIMKLINGVLKK